MNDVIDSTGKNEKEIVVEKIRKMFIDYPDAILDENKSVKVIYKLAEEMGISLKLNFLNHKWFRSSLNTAFPKLKEGVWIPDEAKILAKRILKKRAIYFIIYSSDLGKIYDLFKKEIIIFECSLRKYWPVKFSAQFVDRLYQSQKYPSEQEIHKEEVSVSEQESCNRSKCAIL